jgi:hypothetical protein
MLAVNIHTYLRISFGRPHALNYITVVCLSMFMSSKHIAGAEVKLHTFLTSEPVEVCGYLHTPCGKNAQHPLNRLGGL